MYETLQSILPCVFNSDVGELHFKTIMNPSWFALQFKTYSDQHEKPHYLEPVTCGKQDSTEK